MGPRDRHTLRHCPLCSAVAVRAVVTETLEDSTVRVHLQCGQCATWRRCETTAGRLRRHTRDVARDRRAIERLAGPS